jgi:hypothetical protein
MPRIDRYTKTVILTDATDYNIRMADGTLARVSGASMDRDTIYLDRWPEGWAEASFHCPCGCSQPVIGLPLKPAKANDHADWDVKIEESGRTTLSPSVNQLHGCRSHYTITDGRVQWH